MQPQSASSNSGWGVSRPHHCSLYEPNTTVGPSNSQQAQPERFLSCNVSEGEPVRRRWLTETAQRVKTDVLRRQNCVIRPAGPPKHRHSCGLAGSALFWQLGNECSLQAPQPPNLPTP